MSDKFRGARGIARKIAEIYYERDEDGIYVDLDNVYEERIKDFMYAIYTENLDLLKEAIGPDNRKYDDVLVPLFLGLMVSKDQCYEYDKEDLIKFSMSLYECLYSYVRPKMQEMVDDELRELESWGDLGSKVDDQIKNYKESVKWGSI